MKKIEVKFDAKAKDVLANTLDLGGSSIIEVTVNNRITLDGNKLLQLLIAKNVDVDAEVTDGGILLGCAISFEPYLMNTVHPNILSIGYRWGGSKDVSWELGNGMYANVPIESQDPITYKTMLQTLGTSDIDVIQLGVWLVPFVALQTSSVEVPQPIDITTDEFLSFLTITPLSEEQPELDIHNEQ